MPSRHRAILCGLGASAVLAGCGAGAPVRVEGATLRLELDEYRIRPASIEVRADSIRIVAHNAGRLTHNAKVEEKTDVEAATPIAYGGTPTAFPGQTVTSDPIRLRPGVYRLVCTVGNHQNLGQYAELHVLAPGA